MWECQAVAARSDSPSVGRYDDEHLRRFLAARKAGDVAAMRTWWEELVIDFTDRMNGLVMANHKGRLDHAEHEEAVQRALVKFSTKLIDSFAGSSMGELVNATKTLCRFVCIDVADDAAAYRKKHYSLEDGWSSDGEDERPSPQWEADAARAAYENEESEADMEVFLAWALPQLIASRREVLERTLAGVPVAEICAELDLSKDNAYQLRSRGTKDLAKLYEQYTSS